MSPSCCNSHESSNAKILETPATSVSKEMAVRPSTPRIDEHCHGMKPEENIESEKDETSVEICAKCPNEPDPEKPCCDGKLPISVFDYLLI
jgi:hypothetical protein